MRDRLLRDGHQVTTIGTRDAAAAQAPRGGFYLQADTTSPGPWQDAVRNADVIYNLTGKTIFKRWSKSNKNAIYDSRIATTERIVEALPDQTRTVLISTSAVGYYGDGGEQPLTEASASGQGFLAELARDWEDAAARAALKGARVVQARFGIVLGRHGGALAAMLPAFKAFMGGPLGSGAQWFPWIHIEDILRALVFLADQPGLSGAFNLCAPNPVRNREMAIALGRRLGRPARMAVPPFMLRTMMGAELAGVLLASQRVLPERLLASGFRFRFEDIEQALADLLAGQHRDDNVG